MDSPDLTEDVRATLRGPHRLRSGAAGAASGAPACERAGDAASWPLRMAQRAFAALLDQAPHRTTSAGTFRSAQRFAAARRTLSALSADDHARLVRWLAVQIGTTAEGAQAVGRLARVDAVLAAGVAAAALRAGEELHAHASAAAA